MADWSAPAPDSDVYRRASGRRHYNSLRAFRVTLRRAQVAHLMLTTRGRGLIGTHGVQAQISRALGVSEATISRDCTYLHRQWLDRLRGGRKG